MTFSNKLYDILKWICLIALPALGTFYGVLAGVFGWGNTEVVLTVLGALEAFLGTLIGISTTSYNKEV